VIEGEPKESAGFPFTPRRPGRPRVRIICGASFVELDHVSFTGITFPFKSSTVMRDSSDSSPFHSSLTRPDGRVASRRYGCSLAVEAVPSRLSWKPWSRLVVMMVAVERGT
jgi:hypothetical protein